MSEPKIIKFAEPKQKEKEKEQKVVFHKSYQNSLIDAQSIRKYVRGVSAYHKIKGNMSGMILIELDDTREYTPFISLQCNDNIGSLSGYIVSDKSPSQLCVCVENLTELEREVRVNYICYFD